MSKTIEVEIIVDKSINEVQNIVKQDGNPFITVGEDSHYSKCIENVGIPTEPIEPGVQSECHASTSNQGACYFEDSNFGLYFFDNKGMQIGFVHFQEDNSGGPWLDGETGVEIQATATSPGYIISTITGLGFGTADYFTVTINGEAATGS